MRDAWHGLALSLGFLTRLPAPNVDNPSPRAFAWALFWFPGAGGLLGVLLAAALVGGQAAGLDALPLAAALVTLWALLTGALHLDGVADTFDGLSGGRSPAARREIMRDSRIGAHGATALALVLLLKFALLTSWVQRGSAGAAALIGAALVARFVAVYSITFFRYASADGLGTSFKTSAGLGSLCAAALWCLIFAAFPAPMKLAAAAGVTFVIATLAALHLSRRLDGLTGDAYGALIELAEVAFLLALLLANGPESA